MGHSEKTKLPEELSDNSVSISEEEFIWVSQSLSLEACDSAGNTLLHVAASRGYTEACQALLAAGSDGTRENAAGLHPSDVALECGHLQLALSLRRAGGSALNRNDSFNEDPPNSSRHGTQGSFSPTPKTNILDGDADWLVPEELDGLQDGQQIQKAVEKEFQNELLRIREVLRLMDAVPEHSVTALYLRMRDIMENLRSAIEIVDMDNQAFYFDELKNVNSIAKKRVVEESVALIEPVIDYFLKIVDSATREITEIQKIADWFGQNSKHSKLMKRAETSSAHLNSCVDEVSLCLTDFKALPGSLRANDFDECFPEIENLDYFLEKIWGFHIHVSSVCNLVEGDLFENGESIDEDLLRLDVQCGVPEGFEGATADFPTEWDQRLWEKR